jgi:RNA polymerase sigma-70 factor (ECF subfamily)
MEKGKTFIEDSYTKYGPMVLRRCRSILHDEDAALDAMQDVFIRLISRQDTVKDQFLSSYLYRIATNICLNMIRDNHAVSVSPDNAVITMMAGRDDSVDRFITRDFIDYVFKNEKRSTREMAYMYYVENRTRDEVSAHTGLSSSAVGKRMRVLKNRVQHFNDERV